MSTPPDPTPAATPAIGPAAPRNNADYRWTVKKVTAFLRALAAHGKVAQAAREVGMSRQSAYALKARLQDRQFQDLWARARRNGWAARERLRAEARLAASPWGEPGLAAWDHLRSASRPAASAAAATAPQAVPEHVQADTFRPQADTSAAQGDTFRGQADTFGRQADTFGRQADN